MAETGAFGALRFTEKAGPMEALACPPYDIISDTEREEYLAQNPRNIIRLELPREGADPYETAGETLSAWLEEGYLACDDPPGLYIYEEQFLSPDTGEPKRFKGVTCRVRLEEWEKGVVLPHEETLSKAKTDRFNLMKATGCNFSSIYSLYFDEDRAVSSRLDDLSSGAPDLQFQTADGITHRLWRVTDPAAIAAISTGFADKKLYIADGHHRYETAINYRNYLREQGVVTDREHPANFVMMLLVNIENPGLVVLPTHRVVRDLPHFDAQALLEGCAAYFTVEDCPHAELSQRLRAAGKDGAAFGFAFPGGAKLLTLRDREIMNELLPGASDDYRWLDVNILHTLILERLLGIDKENMANQKNLIYTRDAEGAFAAVEKGEANCAFLLNATRIEEIAGVAGAGEKMPQKSTYFYPKVITGHVMNPLFTPKHG